MCVIREWIFWKGPDGTRGNVAAGDCFMGGLILSPCLALVYIQKKQLCFKTTKENRSIYKLLDLMP